MGKAMNDCNFCNQYDSKCIRDGCQKCCMCQRDLAEERDVSAQAEALARRNEKRAKRVSPVEARKSPSRRDLLLVIGELQNLIGEIQAVDNDRNQRREDDKQPLFKKAHQLCVDARSFDPPLEGGSRAGWPYPEGEEK